MSNELTQHLKTLKMLKSRIQPDQAWVRATRATLLMQAKNSVSGESASVGEQVSHVMKELFPARFVQIIRGPAMAIASVFVVVLGGSVASVSAAERSLPGDFWYTLKLATEQARLALTSGKEEKLKLKIAFTTRRVEDLKQVAQQDSKTNVTRVAQAAEILKRDLNTVKQQLDDVKTSDPKKVVEVAKLVDQKTAEVVQTLQDTKTNGSLEVKGKVVEVQAAAADTGVKAIEVLVEKQSEAKDVLPATDVVQAMQDHSKVVANATGDKDIVATSTTLNMLFAVATTTPVEEPSTTQALGQAVEDLKTATTQAFQKEGDSIASSTAALLNESSSSSASMPTVTSSTESAAPSTSTSSTNKLVTPP